MSKEQIEEVFKDLCEAPTGGVNEDFTIGTLKESHTNLFIRTLAGHLVSLNYRKQSEWISVDERLPRYNDKVLVYRPTMGEKILADTYKGYYNEDTGDWEEGWVNFGQNSIGMNVITHWMPLPEPPKGD